MSCATPPAPSPARPPLTIDRLYDGIPLGGRLPELTWTPDGSALTFIEGSRLVRRDVTTGAQSTLLDFALIGAERPGLDPAPIGRAAPGRAWWNPTGDTLLLHHHGDLWTWRDGTATRLTTTSSALRDPTWAPDGRRVSFVRNHDLWCVDLSGVETRLTSGGNARLLNGDLDWVYPEELGSSTAHWWSPDSTRVAFLQLDESNVAEFPLVDYRPRLGKVAPMLYPKAGDPNPIPRVGICAPGGSVAWVDLGTDTDIYVPRVWWMPDGSLMVLRLNRAQTKLEAIVWRDGAVRTAFTLTDDAWVDVPDDLVFLRDGCVFTSDRDGWAHVWFHPYAGVPRQITKGSFEVARIVAADDSTVWFESNEGSVLERHLWSVPLAGGDRTRLTGRAGWHSVRFSPTRTHYLDTFSDAANPPQMALCRADGSTVALIPGDAAPDFRAFDLAAPEFVRVGARDAMLVKPRDFDPAKKHPVLVHTYGGPGSQLVANRWGGVNFLWHRLLTQHGYVVFTIDGAGAGGRGRNREHHRRFGERELAAQIEGLDWLSKQSWCDASRIGLWGWSYGGFMACYALTHTDRFKAGIAVAPVTDWRLYDTIYTERYLKRPQENADGYRLSSPVHEAGALSGRLLLVHGTDDDNVHFQNSIVFADRLIEAKKPFDFMLYPGRSHGIWGGNARPHLYRLMTEFLLRNL